LNVIELHMPSLNERQEDIPLLAHRFLTEIAEQWEGQKSPEISEKAIQVLQRHHYTGNVRELINILQRAVTMSEGNAIEPEDLFLEHVEVRDSIPDEKTKSDEQSLDSYIENIEKKMLEDALQKARYNKTRAAELLGISFRSFRYKLKKFGID